MDGVYVPGKGDELHVHVNLKGLKSWGKLE